ncbi:MAG: glycosyltransferase family 9 protein, partial [Anaerohalosphaeraceae bacterium]
QGTAFDRNALSHLTKQVAGSFMDHYYQDSHYDEGYIDLLCEMAAFGPDAEWSKVVSSAFFSTIIEELCDDYEDFQFETYNRVMSQVISYYRNLPAAQKLDQYLHQFHLGSADELFRRANRIHARNFHFHADTKTVKQIYLLSRITVGADIAIVSVMIQRLSVLFPDAQIILLGSLKLQDIFGGNPRLCIREVPYIRSGSLLERLESWCRVIELLDDKTVPDKDAVLWIDPDSRITQLGMLPICEEHHHLYFNSHRDWASTRNACMAEHANAWLDKVFGRTNFCYPRVWLEPQLLNQARILTHSLRQNGCQCITAVNFGVGGNPRKRLSLDFEKKLIGELLKQPKSVVILDQGFGADEVASSRQIISDIQNKGYPVHQARFDQTVGKNFPHGLLAIECTIGQISALIGGSDEYIGYDSACQHIAAAMAVPTITVFTGSNNPRFIRRWSACGNTSCRVVHVDTLGHPDTINPDDIISRIMEERLPAAPRAKSRTIIIDVNPPKQKIKKQKLKKQT